MAVRQATHAGTWYESNPKILGRQIVRWVDQAPKMPSAMPRGIIVPHAGYSYSGEIAALSYASLLDSKKLKWNPKRIILIGPFHQPPSNVPRFQAFMSVSAFGSFETPFGVLQADKPYIQRLLQSGEIQPLDSETDLAEHCLEMQFPFIGYFMPHVPIVPLLYMEQSPPSEGLVQLFQRDTESLFILSSDFCHYGSRFSYQPFSSSISERIEAMDKQGIQILEQHPDPKSWQAYLQSTGNTICGRNPILFYLRLRFSTRFQCLGYAQSAPIRKSSDSSVSYVAMADFIDSSIP